MIHLKYSLLHENSPFWDYQFLNASRIFSIRFYNLRFDAGKTGRIISRFNFDKSVYLPISFPFSSPFLLKYFWPFGSIFMMTDVSCIRKDRLLRIDRKPPEIKPQTRLNHYLSKYGLNIRDGHTCIEQKLNQEHIECTMSTKSALWASRVH